ncbi:hypothetical protein SPRG_20481 [Saprolegnia parasitica CBS 223.65]|uniref:Transmembrane protein n=1 Tax=Saprolegnia parasitica (strain CBS 223.65) TaxID=695850 RepID=A0A067CIT4_SAPPC|nr:hypothetical protein SPRG_20481 [Saprolegnia parasitica CBS 223.65]KDO26677.1 hypothetical protein SPRG_20481 [Saprolegnia parasitica CBS 223.65]|eukprot:XP_012202575.1 hypothetical protein SPRG_20481 [Saprolegnia parasitica CBS 223.65]
MQAPFGSITAGPHALRSAGAFFFQSAAFRFLQYTLNDLLWYVLMKYLEADGQQYSETLTLIDATSYLRFFFCVFSDIWPMFGYRRKSWLLLGWAIAVIALSLGTVLPIGAPYCDFVKYPVDCMRNERNDAPYAAFNSNATDKAGRYTRLFAGAALGVAVIGAALNGLMVQYAQVQDDSVRGSLQASFYCATTVGRLASSLLQQFALNFTTFGGDYDWILDVQAAFGLCLAVALLAMVSTLWLDEVKSTRCQFGVWWTQLWAQLQTRAVWRVVAFYMFFGMFQGVYMKPITSWLTGSSNDWFSTVDCVVPFLVYAVVGRVGRAWSWRTAILMSSLACVALRAFSVVSVTQDIDRSATFNSILLVLMQAAMSVTELMCGFVLVETTGAGYEATFAGLRIVISYANSTWINQWSTFIREKLRIEPISTKDGEDTLLTEIVHASYVVLGIQLIGLCWIALLPTQKARLLELKDAATAKPLAGFLVVIGVMSLVSYPLRDLLFSLVDYLNARDE